MRSMSNDRRISTGIRSRAGRAAGVCTLTLLSAAMLAGCDQSTSDIRQTAERAVSEARQQTGSGSAAESRSGATQRVTVTRAIDGDTVEIEPAVRGRTDLRLVGVDSPELDGSEPLSQEAADFTAERLEDERVRLTLGREAVDPYGRLLGTVQPEGGQQSTHGQLLLERGYAQSLFYEPNTQYQMLYRATQNSARERGAGMWGLSIKERCELANRGNGIGASSPECEG